VPVPAVVAVPGPRSEPTPRRLALVPDDRRAQLADLLAVAGPGAVVSHAAAAHLYGFSDLVAWRAEVSTPRCDRYRVRKVRAHRSLDLGPADITEHRGLPVTTVARMLVDLSARCTEWALLELFDRAVAEGRVSRDELAACCERLRQAPGRRRSVIRALLARRAPGAPRLTALDLRVATVVRAAGLPALATHAPVSERPGAYRLALSYPGSRVWVITGAPGFALGPGVARLHDALRGAGWRIVPVTWAMTDTEIVRAVGAALSRR
jgi:hypothetical protein